MDGTTGTAAPRETQEAANVRLVEELYRAAWEAEDDPEALLTRLGDDVEWVYPPIEGIGWASSWRGHDGVGRWAELHDEEEEVLAFRKEDLVAEGDRVVVLGSVHMRTIATGREWQTRFAHVVTLREGLVVRFEAHFDTAACVRAHPPLTAG
jgi:ketosteroid isomerase-like protein